MANRRPADPNPPISTHVLGDIIGGVVFMALATALVRQPRGVAQEVEAAGQAFTASIRAAQGLPAQRTADEQLALFERDYLQAEDADLSELEAELDWRLGLGAKRARPHRSVLSGLVSRHRLPGDPLRWLD